MQSEFLAVDEFTMLLRDFGEPMQGVVVDRKDAEKYVDRVPEALIRFWVEHGRGCYYEGKDWICDPAPFIPVIEAVFSNDDEFRPDDLVAIKRQAFADLTMWSSKISGPVTVDFNTGSVSSFGPDTWIDENTGNRFSADFIVSALFYRARYVEAWVTEDDQDMLPLAIERCGKLGADELYGFFPALQLGGANKADNLKRVKAVEHLLFLSEITDFMLMQTTFPNSSDPSAYNHALVRQIGKTKKPK